MLKPRCECENKIAQLQLSQMWCPKWVYIQNRVKQYYLSILLPCSILRFRACGDLVRPVEQAKKLSPIGVFPTSCVKASSRKVQNTHFTTANKPVRVQGGLSVGLWVVCGSCCLAIMDCFQCALSSSLSWVTQSPSLAHFWYSWPRA